jgi:hypothetical protein
MTVTYKAYKVTVNPTGPIGEMGNTGPVGPAGPLVPPAEVRPQDVGLVAWTVSPQRYVSYCAYAAATYVGKVMLFGFMSAQGGPVSRLQCCGVAGAGMSNAYAGLYDQNSNLIAKCSTDLSSALMTTNVTTATLDAPVTLTPGTFYRVGLVVGAATTYPQLTGFTLNTAAITNMGIAPANCLAGMGSGSGLTALPASHGTLTPIPGGQCWVMS